MVLYGFLEISKTVIGVAKITVRFSFSCPVSRFFRNFEVSFMVLYGSLEISKTVIGVAKITARYSSLHEKTDLNRFATEVNMVQI